MIKYNTLSIEGNYLIIDIETEDRTYYNNLKIIGLRIDTPSTYETSIPYYGINIEETSSYRVEIPISDAKEEMFIITPQVNVTFSQDIPCGADVIDKAVIYDKAILLNKGLGYLKELGNTCEIPKNLIDFILKEKALDIAIVTCNYDMAIKYWNLLTKVEGAPIKGCNCNDA